MANPIGSFSSLSSDVLFHELLPHLTWREVGLLLRCSKTFHTLIKTLVEENFHLCSQWIDRANNSWACIRSRTFNTYERVPTTFYKRLFRSVFDPNELSRTLPKELRHLVLDQMMREPPKRALSNRDTLLQAATIGHSGIVDMILRTAAPESITAEDQGRAFVKACRQGNAQAAMRIQEEGLVSNADEEKAMFLAGKNRHLNILRRFPVLALQEALAGAALSGSAATVKEVSRFGVGFIGNGLINAFIAENEDVIEELLTNNRLALSPYGIKITSEELFQRGHFKNSLDLINRIGLTNIPNDSLGIGLCEILLPPLLMFSLIVWTQIFTAIINRYRHEQGSIADLPLPLFLGSISAIATSVFMLLSLRFHRFTMNNDWAIKNEFSLKERVKYVLVPNPRDLIAQPIVVARVTIELARRGLCSIAHRFTALSPKTQAALHLIFGVIFALSLYAVQQYYTSHQPEADFNAIN